MNDSCPTTETLIDPAAIQELRALSGPDEPDLFRELVGLFLQDTPPRLAALDAGIAAGDFGAAEHAAHSMKSTSANLGARGLSQLCGAAETAARERRPEGLPDLAARIRAMYARVEAELGALLAQ